MRLRDRSRRNGTVATSVIADQAPRESRPKAVRMDGCWAWGGNLDDYGNVLGDGGRLVHAHRWAWEMLHGPIPEGHHIHHECRHPGCVNPEHLRCVTPFEHKRIHMGLAGLSPVEALAKRVLDSRRDS